MIPLIGEVQNREIHRDISDWEPPGAREKRGWGMLANGYMFPLRGDVLKLKW